MTAVGDPAHQLVALVGSEEEGELAQQVAPATGQAADRRLSDEARARVCEIVNGRTALPTVSPASGSCLRMASLRSSWRRPPKRRVRAIRDRLRELYGRPVNQPHGDPIAELVRTILSQNTNDTNRDVAYERLRERASRPGRRSATRRSTR